MLEVCLAKLDGGKHGLTFASGLGATTAITQMLSAGDHILSGDDIYGGTNRLFSKVITKFGIKVDLVDMTNISQFEAAIKPNTRVSCANSDRMRTVITFLILIKMVWLETPTNPLLKVIDIEAISKIAHKHTNVSYFFNLRV